MADEKKDRWKTALVEAAAQGKPRVEVRKRLVDIENRTDPSEEFPADTFKESSSRQEPPGARDQPRRLPGPAWGPRTLRRPILHPGRVGAATSTPNPAPLRQLFHLEDLRRDAAWDLFLTISNLF